MSFVSPVLPRIDYIHLRHEQASGVGSGSNTALAWGKCTVNTEVLDTGNFCTLAASVFTLQPGTYEISAIQELSNAQDAKLRLRNTSDGTNAAIGVNNYVDSVGGYLNTVAMQGQFTIATAKNFELQYYVNVAGSFGRTVVSGIAEVYCDIYLRKVA